MPSPSQGERVYTCLFLFSVASRSLPDDTSPDLIRLDRTALWRLAAACGAREHVGRNTFHALASELADDVPDVIELLRRGGGRWSVDLFRVDSDAAAWTDDVLEPLGFEDVRAALAAADKLGIDVSSPLPADLLLPFSADEDFDEEDLTEKVCTRCGVEQSADDFSERNTGQLSSWCRSCSVEATRQWRDRQRPASALRLPVPEILQRPTTPLDNASKVCPGCRTRKPLSYYHRDSSRGDDHAVRCRACRSDGARDAALRRFTDF